MRVLSLAKGAVSIESLFAEPTYSAKTKRACAVPSKLSYHGRTFKVTTLGCSVYSKASKAIVPSFVSKVNGSFSFNDGLKQAA